MIEEIRTVEIIKREIVMMRIMAVASTTIGLLLIFIFFHYDKSEWSYAWSNVLQQSLDVCLFGGLVSPFVLVHLNRELRSLKTNNKIK